MQVVYEGQVVRTSADVDYDYLEIKYVGTARLGRKPFIRVPISYPGCSAPCGTNKHRVSRGQEAQPRHGDADPSCETSENLTETDSSTDALDISSREGVSGLFSSGDLELLRDSTGDGGEHEPGHCDFFEYSDSSERCLLINYVKESKVRAGEGILRYDEFADFLVTESRIVHCESFIVRKPFHIEERLHPTFKALRIERLIPGDIRVSTDCGDIVQHDSEYRAFGRCAFYSISTASIAYRFPSRVYRKCQ